MYQFMRKGRAKSYTAKKAATKKFGDQSKLPKRSVNGGISEELKNTREKLKSFFGTKMVHRKRYIQRDTLAMIVNSSAMITAKMKIQVFTLEVV